VRARHPGNYDLYARQPPGQTVGPFFAQGLVRVRSVFADGRLCPDERDALHNILAEGVLADGSTPGERLRLEGTVYDGLGRPIPDAMIEIWQADAEGRYRHPLQLGERYEDATFHGFGRAPTDAAGRYFFETIRPGALNLMSAGKGIVHSERSGAEARSVGAKLFGIQSWVALPRSHEEGEPGFVHYAEDRLPILSGAGVTMRLIAGEALGTGSPVETPMAMIYADVSLAAGASSSLGGKMVSTWNTTRLSSLPDAAVPKPPLGSK